MEELAFRALTPGAGDNRQRALTKVRVGFWAAHIFLLSYSVGFIVSSIYDIS
ncbi:MAG: hypothetical protein BMS9Abin34_199 [Patescibacteria group bacterium]|nr:MAG: hypothetical protein BMS9Abin34_199 [Patescibacteria group bacterium]